MNKNPLTPRDIKAVLLTELFEKYDITIYDATPNTGNREEEIRKWIKDNPGVESFLVIDDDLIGFSEEERLLKTTFYCINEISGGLQEFHIEPAIKILERKLK